MYSTTFQFVSAKNTYFFMVNNIYLRVKIPKMKIQVFGSTFLVK